MSGLHVLAAECVTSIGHTLDQTDIALRCMIQRVRRTHLQGTAGAIRAAPILPIGAGRDGVERGIKLLGPALSRAVEAIAPGSRVGLAVCSSRWAFVDALAESPELMRQPFEDLRTSWMTLPERIASELGARGLVVSQDRTFLVAEGHPSALLALPRIQSWIASNEADLVVLVAVASDCHRPLLELFDAWGMTKREGEPGGIIPSEAAVVLVLGGRPTNRRGMARIAAHATATDPDHRRGSPQAVGLTRAMHAVLDAEAPAGLAEVFSDAGGERWRNLELQVASLRTLGTRSLRPAHLGVGRQTCDVGCAGGALSLALAAHAVASDGRPRLAVSSTPGPQRGAALLIGDESCR